MSRQQLRYLLTESERENVALLVIPFEEGGFPLIGVSVLYAVATDEHLDTVHMDSPTGAVFIDSPTQLKNFRRRLDLIEQAALPASKSRDHIHAIVQDL